MIFKNQSIEPVGSTKKTKKRFCFVFMTKNKMTKNGHHMTLCGAKYYFPQGVFLSGWLFSQQSESQKVTKVGGTWVEEALVRF